MQLDDAQREAFLALLGLEVAVHVLNDDTLRVSFEENGAEVTRDELSLLASLPNVSDLDLFATPVDDDALAAILSPALRSLNLNGTAVRDTGVANVSNCPRLQRLGLMNTQVTDAIVPSLLECGGLRDLRLDGTQISDAGVIQLAKALPLDALWLDGGQATPECLGVLAEAGTLHQLNLCGPDITDATLEGLPSWPGLRSLGIFRSKVTNEGLPHLGRMARIETLALQDNALLTGDVQGALPELPQLEAVYF